jgi:uncharacterized membrane protein
MVNFIPTRSTEPRWFLSQREKNYLAQTIDEVETITQGEIRIHLTRKLGENPLDKASELFARLGMARTDDRLGVLIVLGCQDHKVVLLGDSGINEKVEPGFWQEVIEAMIPLFRADQFAEGLALGVHLVGNRLRQHFPAQRENLDELPDEVSYDL